MKLKWKRCLIGLILALLLLLLAYPSWCNGLWGRDSLLMQYLFQCKCPTHSEALRYSKRVDIIISACQGENTSLRISPQGTLLDVNQKYILDLRTGKLRHPPSTEKYTIISDSLFLIDTNDPYVLDLNNQIAYPIKHLYNLPVLTDGQVDPSAILPIFQSAQKIYLLGGILLIVDENTTYLSIEEVNLTGQYGGGALAQQFLDTYHIPYEASLQHFPGDLPSHTGRFYEKSGGIYLSATNERIAESYYSPNSKHFGVVGWEYDDKGVILEGSAYLVKFTLSMPGLDSSQLRYFRVPQPVLMLKVPEKYLPATPTQ